MHPRLARLIVIFLLAALVISACGQASPAAVATLDLSTVTPTNTPGPAPTVTATPPTPISIDPASLRGVSIQVWHAFAGSSYDVFARQAAQFSAANEWGILVTPSGYGDYTTLFNAMGTALDSGQPPDLVSALPEQALTWDATGAVVDLNAYLADPTWGLGRETIADIPSAFLAQDNVNGKQLGLPAQRSARFLFYNQTWARELGFEKPPGTADEFRQQACAANASFLKDKDPKNDGYGGWIVDPAWQTSYSWLLAFDGDVADGKAYGFRTDPNLAALQFLKGLYDDHCAWLSTEPTPFDSFSRRSALFVSGDLAELSLAAETMLRRKNTDEWVVIPFPGPQKRVVVVYGPSYTLMKSTPEKQLAAFLFARWLLSPENQAQWVEASGLFPLRTSMLSLIGSFQAASPQWDGAVGDLNLAQGVPQLASWRKVRYVLEDGMTAIFKTDTHLNQLPSMLAEMDKMAAEMK